MRRTISVVVLILFASAAALFFYVAPLAESYASAQLRSVGFSSVELEFTRPRLNGVGAPSVTASYLTQGSKIEIRAEELTLHYSLSKLLESPKAAFERITAGAVEVNFIPQPGEAAREERGSAAGASMPDIPLESIAIDKLTLRFPQQLLLLRELVLRQREDLALEGEAQAVYSGRIGEVNLALKPLALTAEASLKDGRAAAALQAARDSLKATFSADYSLIEGSGTANAALTSTQPATLDKLAQNLGIEIASGEATSKLLGVLELSELRADAEFDNQRLSADLHLIGNPLSVGGKASYSPASGRAQWQLASEKISAGDAVRLISTAAPALSQTVAPVSGQLKLACSGSFHNDAVRGTLQFTLKDSTLNFGELRVAGLDASGVLRLEAGKLSSASPISLSAAALALPVPLTDARASLSIPPFSLEKAQRSFALSAVLKQAKAFGGAVSSEEFKYRPGTDTTVVLSAKGLEIPQILELYPNENLNATGLLDATFPLHIGPAGVSVSGGRVEARAPGGSIKYNAPAALSDNPSLKLAADALKNYQYSSLKSSLAYTPAGELQLGLSLEGTSPEIDVNRPVHLNINISENIPALINSLKVTGELERRIEEVFKGRSAK